VQSFEQRIKLRLLLGVQSYDDLIRRNHERGSMV
jgi:hypothetical protein